MILNVNSDYLLKQH